MKTLLLASLLALASFAQAEDKKLDGTITCAKCDLKTADQCQTVVIVKDGDKKDIYQVAENDKAKEVHGDICTKAKPAVVEGEIEEKDGKKTITLSKVEWKK